MKPVALNHLLKTTREALLLGGSVLKKGFSQKRRISYKTPISPVTQIDRSSEAKIVGLIRKRYPGHTFLAEESAFIKKGDLKSSRPNSYRWIIDPLDGTTNYIHRIPQSCVSVAVERNGEVLAGGVCDPFRGELFLAKKNGGATCNGRRIRVSRKKKLIDSLLITGFPYDRNKNGKFYLKVLEPFLKTSMGIRRFGAAALDLSWIACGRAEGFWEYNLSPWDVAAGLLLVREAGGKVTDFSNKNLDVDQPRQTLATNGFIHSKMIRVFKQTSKKMRKAL